MEKMKLIYFILLLQAFTLLMLFIAFEMIYILKKEVLGRYQWDGKLKDGKKRGVPKMENPPLPPPPPIRKVPTNQPNADKSVI